MDRFGASVQATNVSHSTFTTNNSVTVDGNSYLRELYRRASVPALFDSLQAEMYAFCMEGTRVSTIEEITTWAHSTTEGPSILLVHGSAGQGKSSLARTMARIFKKEKELALAVFCPSLGHEGTFVPTMAYQLCQTIPDVAPFVEKAIESDPAVFERTFASQFENLVIEPYLATQDPSALVDTTRRANSDSQPILQTHMSPVLLNLAVFVMVVFVIDLPAKYQVAALALSIFFSYRSQHPYDSLYELLWTRPLLRSQLPHLTRWFHDQGSQTRSGPFVFIIDGLEFCQPSTRTHFLHGLSDLVSRLPQTNHFRFLIIGRPDIEIQHWLLDDTTTPLFKITRQLNLNAIERQEELDADVRLYFNREMQKLRLSHPYRSELPDHWPNEEDVQEVVRRAAGHFSYATLMMKYIAAHYSPDDGLNAIVRKSKQPIAEGLFSKMNWFYASQLNEVMPPYLPRLLLFFGILYKKSCGLLDDIPLTRATMDQILDIRKGTLDAMVVPILSLVQVAPYPSDDSQAPSLPTRKARQNESTFRVFQPFFFDYLLDIGRSHGRFTIELSEVERVLESYRQRHIHSPTLPMSKDGEDATPKSSPLIQLKATIDLTVLSSHPATSLANELLECIRDSRHPERHSELCTAVMLQSQAILQHASSILGANPAFGDWNIDDVVEIGREVLPMVERTLRGSYVLGLHKPPDFSPPCYSILEDSMFIARTFALRRSHLATLFALEASPGGQSMQQLFGVYDLNIAFTSFSDAFSQLNPNALVLESRDAASALVSRTVKNGLRAIQDVVHKAQAWEGMPEESFQIVVKSLMLLLSVYRPSRLSSSKGSTMGICQDPPQLLTLVNLIQMLDEHVSSRGAPPLGEGRARKFIDFLVQHLNEHQEDLGEVRVIFHCFLHSSIPPATIQPMSARDRAKSILNNPDFLRSSTKRYGDKQLASDLRSPEELESFVESLGQLMWISAPSLDRTRLQEYISDPSKLSSIPGREAMSLLAKSLEIRDVSNPDSPMSDISANISRLNAVNTLFETQLLASYSRITDLNASNEVLLDIVREAAGIQVRWRSRAEWLLRNLPKLCTLHRTQLDLAGVELGTPGVQDGANTEDRLPVILITLLKSTNLLDWEDSSPAVASERMEIYQRWENLMETEIFAFEDGPEGQQLKSAYRETSQADEEEYDQMRPFLPLPSSSELFKAAIMCIRKNFRRGKPA